LNKNRLEPEEVATLLNVEDPELLEEIFHAARTLKERIYGNRIVLFAPLYIGNDCVNDCVYCGFRTSNKEVYRKTLTFEELRNEVRALVSRGHKRLIVVYGEHPRYSPEFIAETIRIVYETKSRKRRDKKGKRECSTTNCGRLQNHQRSRYWNIPNLPRNLSSANLQKTSPRGPKSNYAWRLYGLDRAMIAGIDDVGIGALFGLFNWKFEVMGLIYHTIHLEERFGVGPHTISFPRIEPAVGSEISYNPPHKVSDDDFKKLVAIIRLAVPYTGMILTAREPVELRREVLKMGVSQIDGGSSIGIGSYSQDDPEKVRKSQFILGDNRSLRRSNTRPFERRIHPFLLHSVLQNGTNRRTLHGIRYSWICKKILHTQRTLHAQRISERLCFRRN